MRKLWVLLGTVFLVVSCSKESKKTTVIVPPREASIQFTLPHIAQNTLVKRNLIHRIASHDIRIYDYLYKKHKNYRAFSLEDFLKAGFGEKAIDLASFNDADFVFTDGNGVVDTATIAQIFTLSGYIVFEDLDMVGEENWEIIEGDYNCSPAPFYLVWADSANQSPFHNYPWAIKISGININY